MNFALELLSVSWLQRQTTYHQDAETQGQKHGRKQLKPHPHRRKSGLLVFEAQWLNGTTNSQSKTVPSYRALPPIAIFLVEKVHFIRVF
jgi:hypothetical protein